MKLTTPLWIDPVGWAEKVAKTKCHVCIWAVIHLGVVLGGLFMIYWGIGMLHDAPLASALAVMFGAGPILFIGVVYPAMYLYAMYRLLKIVRERV